MTKLIALDDGHGMNTAGKRTPFIPELGRQIKENEFNREVVKYLDIELRRCGFKTLLVAPTDADTPLGQRTDLANRKGADLYISIHYNAYDSKFDDYDPEGFSAHIYPGHLNKASGKFAKIALKHLSGGTKQRNRGVVEQNLHVVRETKMPAVLFELGFMDNKREALLMLNVDFQKECARELAKAVCEYFGVPYEGVKEEKKATPSKPSTSTSKLYRVRKSWSDAKSQKGAFRDINNAKEVADANPGYKVYDEKGNVVYTGKSGSTSKPEPAPAPKPKHVIPSPTLRKGDRGTRVKQLQNALNAAYFKCGNADGIFGEKTLDALKRFQSVYCNPADGIYGKNTRNALDRKLNG